LLRGLSPEEGGASFAWQMLLWLSRVLPIFLPWIAFAPAIPSFAFFESPYPTTIFEYVAAASSTPYTTATPTVSPHCTIVVVVVC
jgi:hypothetical protein